MIVEPEVARRGNGLCHIHVDLLSVCAVIAYVSHICKYLFSLRGFQKCSFDDRLQQTFNNTNVE